MLDNQWKTGLVMEGGSHRGMFTAGVIDVFMENNITFDGAIGVSAGAVFGCNYKSNQIGRAIRYNKKYCSDKRYGSVRSLIKTGNYFSVDFAYYELPNSLDPFDYEAFSSSPMEFYVVCTEVMTGEPVYHRCDSCEGEEMRWLLASSSMPLAAKTVSIDDYLLSDGGVADSVPLEYFEQIGYNRNIIILTQPKDYIKKKNAFLFIMKRIYHKYPNYIKRIENRHIHYNKTLQYIEKKEKEGEILVFRPKEKLLVSKIEKDPLKLEQAYQMGREIAKERISEVRSFLGQ